MKNVIRQIAALLLFLFTNCGLLFIHPKTAGDGLGKYSLLFGLPRSVASSQTVNAVDRTSPAILTVIPALSSTNIPVSQKIIISFTEEVVPISSAITVLDSSSNAVNGAVTWDKEVLQFTPSASLAYNTKYTVSLGNGIKDSSGNEFPSGFTYDFTTELSPNASPLSVIATTPVNGFLNYNVGSTLNIAFNKQVNATTFTTSNVIVTSFSGNASITVYSNVANGIITPQPAWDYGTTYTVTIKQAVSDTSQNTMSADYIFTFTTVSDTTGPQVVSRIPELTSITPPVTMTDGTATGLTVPGHSINDPIQVNFDELILPASATAGSFTVKQGATTIAGTYSVTGNNVKFTPSSPLPLGTITVTVMSPLQDMSGNVITSPYVFNFVTRNSKIYSNLFHNCVLLPSGKVRCFGSNIFGQLGTGDFNSITTISAANDIRLNEPALKLAVGVGHTCALLLSGSVKCWGTGLSGVLGQGSLVTMTDPFYISPLNIGETIIDIKANIAHTCVVTVSGKYKCWGGNKSGQLGYGFTGLGDPDLDDRTSIFQSPSLNFASDLVKELAIGPIHSCALTTSGKVKCWGLCNIGQCGVTPDPGGPQTDSVGLGFLNLNVGAILPTSISSIGNFICVTLNDGTGKCWGDGKLGEVGTAVPAMGQNVFEAALYPAISIAGKTISKMVTGYASTCALFTDGTMACFGDNTYGQAGSILFPNPEYFAANAVSSHLINFTPTYKIVDASLGYYHGCIVLDSDGINCFGTAINNYALGEGSLTGYQTAIGLGAVNFIKLQRNVTDYD